VFNDLPVRWAELYGEFWVDAHPRPRDVFMAATFHDPAIDGGSMARTWQTS
jgi:hypothetical protein